MHVRSKHATCRAQILGLPKGMSEDQDLKDLFLAFGEINYVHIVRDPITGTPTGEGYVQYADEPMASAAIKHFNGFELVGQKLTVQVAPVVAAPGVIIPAAYALPGGGGALLPPPPPLPVGYPMGGALPPPPSASGLPPPPPLHDASAPPAAATNNEVDDLDEAENSKSFRLNAQSRQALMSRLATSAGLQAPPSFLPQQQQPAASSAPQLAVSQEVLLDQGLLGPASPIPTPCLLLKNSACVGLFVAHTGLHGFALAD
jgi:RNA-binding protein 39